MNQGYYPMKSLGPCIVGIDPWTMSRCPTTSGTCRVCAFWSLADLSIELLPRPGQRCNAPRRRQIASSRGRASPKILSGWLFEHAESLGILGETCQNCFKTCQRSAEKRRPSYNGQKNWGAWLKGVSLNIGHPKIWWCIIFHMFAPLKLPYFIGIIMSRHPCKSRFVLDGTCWAWNLQIELKDQHVFCVPWCNGWTHKRIHEIRCVRCTHFWGIQMCVYIYIYTIIYVHILCYMCIVYICIYIYLYILYSIYGYDQQNILYRSVQSTFLNNNQWPFQEPKLQVPTIYQAYVT